MSISVSFVPIVAFYVLVTATTKNYSGNYDYPKYFVIKKIA